MSPSDGANRRRSERVMLRMSVVVETETVQREKLREQTYTLVVNAHGGLLQLQMEVLAGQPILLINPKSGAKESAHVVRVENPPGGYTAVAFEFDRPSPKFWPVEFPPKTGERRTRSRFRKRKKLRVFRAHSRHRKNASNFLCAAVFNNTERNLP